jgi:hypothetical protein
MLQRPGEVLFDALAGNTEKVGDLLERVTPEACEHQGDPYSGRQLREDALKRLNALLRVEECLGIVRRSELRLGKHIGDIHLDGNRGLANGVLVNDVTGDGEEIRLGTSDRAVILLQHPRSRCADNTYARKKSLHPSATVAGQAPLVNSLVRRSRQPRMQSTRERYAIYARSQNSLPPVSGPPPRLLK